MTMVLYTAATPNGYKASIMLEECGFEYSATKLDLAGLEQKSDSYLLLNPNGRIPTLVDGGFAVFESGAILLYLAEKADHLRGTDPADRSRVVQWLMWQMSALGPMMGQLNVFVRYMPEKWPPAIERYTRECHRLFHILDRQLTLHPYVAGSDYTIADVACWPWIDVHAWSRLSLADYPRLSAWYDMISMRPAVRRGLQVPPKPDLATVERDLEEGARQQLP